MKHDKRRYTNCKVFPSRFFAYDRCYYWKKIPIELFGMGLALIIN